ncbi:uncharacterized protein LOC143285055 [Babylonia areolata]|uniref:uncharacterized protein LOC143285055 n=1 Tax=Babylonia areolata TaxID=304850 RepID=UPI003FD62187
MADGGDSFSAGIRKLAKKCNRYFYEGSSQKSCVGFFIGDVQLGLVRPAVAAKLQKFPEVFDVVGQDSSDKRPAGVHLSQSLKTCEERTAAVSTVMEKLKEDSSNELVTLRAWNDEKYKVSKSFSSETLMEVERAASPLLGIVTYGTHINGYTYNDSGEMLMWLGKRNPEKTTYPGMYDNLCAGGLPAGMGVKECAWKECQEEASIDEELLEEMKPVGTISYVAEDERGVMPECEFIFDLELPQDFEPVNSDGEVESFELVSINRVKELITQDNFKPNCAFIILDFLIRHGFINADEEPDYNFMVEQTHTPLRSLFSSSAS